MTVLLQRFLVFDVLTGTTKGGTRTGACPSTIEQTHGIFVASGTSHCPSLALRLVLFLYRDPEIKSPWILFDFNKLATATIDAGGIAEIFGLALAPLGVGIGFVARHEIHMIGLTVVHALPLSDFFEDF